WTLGFKSRSVSVDRKSLKLIKRGEQLGDFKADIYYGEITSGNDDFLPTGRPWHWMLRRAASIAARYNTIPVDPQLLVPDSEFGSQPVVKLYGYVACCEISPKKKVVLYVSAPMNHMRKTT